MRQSTIAAAMERLLKAGGHRHHMVDPEKLSHTSR
jgi:hypothetical protein